MGRPIIKDPNESDWCKFEEAGASPARYHRPIARTPAHVGHHHLVWQLKYVGDCRSRVFLADLFGGLGEVGFLPCVAVENEA